MFLGRERELALLEKLYQTGTFQFPVLYGRRRVGKTALLAKFSERLPTLFFTAVESDAQVNLRNLSREIHAFEHPEDNPASAPIHPDFYAAFDAVFSLAKRVPDGRPLVFVIDEFPYLAAAEPGVASYLQALIDRRRDESPLFLVLCGSSLSFMKEHILDERSPLYGRRTAQLELAAFDFFDSRRFLAGMSAEDAAQVYGMVGGIPLYLRQFDGSASLGDNVERIFFDPGAILYEEPTNLLKQEVQKAGRYNAMLAAIADGASQNHEIAAAVGLTSTEITYYLKELQRIGLVEREQPLVAPGRRAAYRIADNLFRFWHRFVLPHRSTIERGIVGRARRAFAEHMPTYMGPVFERICRQWLWRRFAASDLDFEFDEVGRWWGADPAARAEAEIDIVCVDGASVAAVGECKWTNEAFSRADLDKLLHRARLVRAGDAPAYAFSKSGFTEACREFARENPRARLLSFEEMG